MIGLDRKGTIGIYSLDNVFPVWAIVLICVFIFILIAGIVSAIYIKRRSKARANQLENYNNLNNSSNRIREDMSPNLNLNQGFSSNPYNQPINPYINQGINNNQGWNYQNGNNWNNINQNNPY